MTAGGQTGVSYGGTPMPGFSATMGRSFLFIRVVIQLPGEPGTPIFNVNKKCPMQFSDECIASAVLVGRTPGGTEARVRRRGRQWPFRST